MNETQSIVKALALLQDQVARMAKVQDLVAEGLRLLLDHRAQSRDWFQVDPPEGIRPEQLERLVDRLLQATDRETLYRRLENVRDELQAPMAHFFCHWMRQDETVLRGMLTWWLLKDLDFLKDLLAKTEVEPD